MGIGKSEMHIAMLSIHSSPIGELGIYDTGGMSVYVRELAKELGGRGHKVDIFTSIYKENDAPVIELHPNVRLVHLHTPARIQTSSSLLYAHLPTLFRFLETFRVNHGMDYDLIHSHYWISGVLGIQAQKQWGRPHVMTFHTVAVIKNQVLSEEKEPELRLIHEKQLVETSNRIVVSSQEEKAFFNHHYHVPPEKISFLPCGVDLDRFQPMDKKNARSQLQLDVNASVVLYVGRFVPIKGLDRLINAMTYLKDNSDVRLIVVGGDGVESAAYQKYMAMVEDLKLKDRILFAGRIEQEKLPLYYNAADVLVLPSYHESFGLAALEALACGTPVITTPMGSMEMIIQNGINGWMVNNDDPQSFARQMAKIYSPDTFQSFSQERIRNTVIFFSWKNAGAELLKIYQDL